MNISETFIIHYLLHTLRNAGINPNVAEWISMYKSLEMGEKNQIQEEWPNFQTLYPVIFDGSVIILSTLIF